MLVADLKVFAMDKMLVRFNSLCTVLYIGLDANETVVIIMSIVSQEKPTSQ